MMYYLFHIKFVLQNTDLSCTTWKTKIKCVCIFTLQFEIFKKCLSQYSSGKQEVCGFMYSFVFP